MTAVAVEEGNRRRRQSKAIYRCPATHMNSFHSSLFALLASHGAVPEKKTDIKGDKHAQVKAMQRRKSSSLRKRGEGGEEIERKGRREGEREGGGRIERHGERILSQIGLGQFVVTKKKKASVSWRGNRKRCLAGASTLLAIVHTPTHNRTHANTHT